ncbi:putative prolyl 4-hydroxylase 9 [Porphyridium purpureum]|uniref:Putative prolyl 4-hydroxylase 9 n=1 Tax=Porphyridium purpureum TaxID=35688 RepID=A0A5J4YNP5_PORPP|nr:putative prolyl 4-hydroxylase 9 [Porphyridium purpureum]|eukprot:POR5286..scf222_8
MGKAGKLKKKRLRLLNGTAAPGYGAEQNDSEEEGRREDEGPLGISDGELAAACRVLGAMAQHPDVFAKRKEFRVLRTLLHSIRQTPEGLTLLGVTGGSHSREASEQQLVSDAIRDLRFEEARRVLVGMQARQKVPPLGAICRWVRDLDGTAEISHESDGDGAGVSPDASSEHDRQNKLFMQMLSEVIRTCSPEQVGCIVPTDRFELRNWKSVRLWLPPWKPEAVTDSENGIASSAGEQAEALSDQELMHFWVCSRVKGPDRLPPNRHDLAIHASSDEFLLSPLSLPAKELGKCRAYSGKEFLGDAGARAHVTLVEGFLTAHECKRIISVAEKLGFDPDEPLSRSLPVSTRSTLAHACVWLQSKRESERLWARIKYILPPLLYNARGVRLQPRGLNRRWRVYRYSQSAVYRPHIDGAWPESGLDDTKQYVYNVNERSSKHVWSKLTFLMYLSDDFEGGETTFFAPVVKALEESNSVYMDARGVRPRQGWALVFPHGEAHGAWLHEGSPVTHGVKYVVRTDVLYEPMNECLGSITVP